jgi:uncharacterized protein (TIGR02099 family)
VFLRYCFAFLKHGSVWSYRVGTRIVLATGVLFVCGVLTLRYWLLPNVDQLRAPIVRTIAQAVKQPLEISHLEGSWRGYRPELKLHGLRVLDPDGQAVLTLDRVDAVLSWVALLSGRLTFHSIEFDGASLEVRRDANGGLWVAGTVIEPGSGEGGGFADWLLSQRQVVVRKASVSWSDELRGAPPLEVKEASFRLDNDAGVHRFGLTGVPPRELATPVTIRGELTGGSVADAASWKGRLYAELDDADLAQAQRWVNLPIRFDAGQGTLKLWIDVADGRVVSITADANLVDARAQLAEGLEPLAMRRLSGRATWRAEPGGFRLGGRRLSFATAEGVVLPAVDIELGRRGAHTELTIDGLELAPVVTLAKRLPLDPLVRERLAATSPSGRIRGAKLQWEGEWDPDQTYSVQADLESLQWRPLGVLPGVRGISGRVNASQRSGTLSLRADAGALELPRVFAEIVPLDFLSAEVDWEVQGPRLLVNVRSAAFINEHAAGNISGSYLSDPTGKGRADFSGQLVRADARAVWRYIPRSAPNTQRWLKRALVRGTAEDVRFRLNGPLERFPFRDGAAGRFEVVSKARGITLAYAPDWPEVEGIDATVAFRGARMEIEATAGRTLGIDVGRTRASIPVLGNREEHLILEGRGSGPIADFLRFIEASPVVEYTNGITTRMRASGTGQLRLDVDLPLHQVSDVKLAGKFDFSAQELQVDPRLPPLADARASVEFSEARVAVRDGHAWLHGSAFNFSGGTQKDGAVALTLGGRIDATALQRSSDSDLARAIEGATEWRGVLSIRNGVSALRIQSSLAGLALRMPPPLAKPAGGELALRLELTDSPGEGAQISASLADVGSARLALERGALKRGEVRFAGRAALPQRDGLTLAGRIDAIDVDAWRQWAAGATGRGRASVTALDLSIEQMTLAGRKFHSVRLKGERGGEAWLLSLEARGAAGTLAWQHGDPDRLSARFSTLVIPPMESGVRPQEPARGPGGNLPALDVVVGNFVFEGKNLGQLEMSARPGADSWLLDRLLVSNPDGRLDVSGKWLSTEPPSTALDVRIEATDAGKLLARLGYYEGVIGAKGSLSGPVRWTGAPYRMDLASLSGQLRLEVDNGRFARLEPGVGKLLGLLSLQAIPRRLSFDFRDLFSSGFSFDRISADVAVAGGVARTENFRMEGSAARVEMHGQVDLAAETHDLKVRILPQLSTGVAIAGAVVNPAVGVATLLAQKALGDPVEKLAAQDYHVSGSWAEPKVERITQKTETPAPRR